MRTMFVSCLRLLLFYVSFQILTKESLHDLERVWAEQGEDEIDQQQQGDPAHLQIFYGQPPASQDDSMAEE